MKILRRKHRKEQAFSLMEVLVAVAVVAVAAIPILGLLSVAIDSSRTAFASVSKARIGAELIGEVQQASWQEAQQWNGREVYYDGDGQRMPDGTAEDSVFTARVRIIVPSRAGTILGSSTSAANPHLRHVLVGVSSRPGTLGSEQLQEAMSNPQDKNRGVDFFRGVLVNTEK